MENCIANRYYKQLFACMLIVAISLVSSGCWDRHELEERRLVLAIAIDWADQEPEQGNNVSQVESFVQPYGSKRYRLSFQVFNIIPSQGNVTSPQGQMGTYVVSNTGESVFEMIRDMLGQVDQALWFEHVQTIIISEAVVRQTNLQSIIDYFRRDREMRHLMKILITSGEARSLLEYQPPSGEPSGIFIVNSLRMHRKNAHIPGLHTDVREITQSIDNKSRVLVGRIELVDNVVKIGGAALFKKGKFIGYMDEYATKGENFLKGIEKSGLVTITCPDHPEKIMVFELFRHNTTLTPHVEGEAIYFTLGIAMRGNLGESQCGKQHNTMDNEVIHKVEELVAEEVKNNILYTFKTYQNLKVDGGLFGAKLEAHEPLAWKKVKDHWEDEIFPNIPLLVSVNVVVENIGEHK